MLENHPDQVCYTAKMHGIRALAHVPISMPGMPYNFSAA
jgi:hypothetical protein